MSLNYSPTARELQSQSLVSQQGANDNSEELFNSVNSDTDSYSELKS